MSRKPSRVESTADELNDVINATPIRFVYCLDLDPELDVQTWQSVVAPHVVIAALARDRDEYAKTLKAKNETLAEVIRDRDLFAKSIARAAQLVEETP